MNMLAWATKLVVLGVSIQLFNILGIWYKKYWNKWNFNDDNKSINQKTLRLPNREKKIQRNCIYVKNEVQILQVVGIFSRILILLQTSIILRIYVPKKRRKLRLLRIFNI